MKYEANLGSQLTLQRHQTPRVQGNVHVKHRAHAVDDRGVYDGYRCVEVAAHFKAGALKVEDGAAGLFVDGDLEGDLWQDIRWRGMENGIRK